MESFMKINYNFIQIIAWKPITLRDPTYLFSSNVFDSFIKWKKKIRFDKHIVQNYGCHYLFQCKFKMYFIRVARIARKTIPFCLWMFDVRCSTLHNIWWQQPWKKRWTQKKRRIRDAKEAAFIIGTIRE